MKRIITIVNDSEFKRIMAFCKKNKLTRYKLLKNSVILATDHLNDLPDDLKEMILKNSDSEN